MNLFFTTRILTLYIFQRLRIQKKTSLQFLDFGDVFLAIATAKAQLLISSQSASPDTPILTGTPR
jgi:hypothetical protein